MSLVLGLARPFPLPSISRVSAPAKGTATCYSLVCFVILALSVPAASTTARGEEFADALHWLPNSTVAYAEISEPGKLLELVLEHPLRDQIEELEAVKDAKSQKPYQDLQTGIRLIEAQLNMSWTEIVKASTAGGAVLAVDAPTQALIVGFYSDGSDTPDRLLSNLITLARLDATANGRDNPVRENSYRDVKVWRAGEARFTRIGRWTWFTNKDDAGKALIDAYHDGRADSLFSSEQFQAALQSKGNTDAWAYLDGNGLRALPNYQQIPDKTDNPAGELLIGGLLDLVKNTPYVAVSLELEPNRIQALIQSPMNHEWRNEAREYWWGSDERGAAPERLAIDNALAQVEFYRDISEMWLRAGDLFVDQTIDQLDQADSTLSTLFSGADFAEDILGAFAPEGHLIIARQDFADAELTPDIKLPSFAVVFSLEDPKRMQPQLKRIFQSLIGFINVAGAMDGQPQLDLNMESADGIQITSGSYVIPDEEDRETEGLPIQYNFSPTIGFAENRCVISSTLQLAKQILTAESLPSSDSVESTSSDAVINTGAQLAFEPLQAILADNQSQLVAQSMLDDGKTSEEATRDIQTLIDLLGWIESLEFDFTHDDSSASVRMELKLDSAQGE